MGASLGVRLVAAIILACAGGAAAEEPTGESNRIDQLFAEWDKPTSPGCAVAVMKDGRIIHERGYGMADLDHDVKISPTTVFHVASMSKQFTAAAILMLAEDGKISLDDPIRKYVSELPDLGGPITLRHLLHHTSGLRDQWELLGLAGWRYSLDLITDADILAVLSRQKALNFPPGSKHLYSNSGYTLLAQVVKRVSGQSFRTYTSTRLFAPLGMSQSFFRDDHAEVVKQAAYGYAPTKDGFKLSITNFDTVGATSLLTTVKDLARWDENFYAARVGGQTLIDRLQERGSLNDGTRLDYAAGLVVGKYRGVNMVSHAGSDAGYRADLIRFPDQHFSVAVLCNLASTNPSLLTRKIADIYLAPALAAVPPPAIAQSPQPGREQLEKWTGLYVEPQEGDRVLRVRLKDGELQGGLEADGRAFGLEATSDERFRYVGEPRTELVFSTGENGAPVTLKTYADGKLQHSYSRAKTFEPSAAELQEYAGIYRSDEVDMPRELVVREGKLVFRSLKFSEISLLPVSADLFNGGGNRIRFLRDAEGRVTGAYLSTFRVYNFRFTRSQ